MKILLDTHVLLQIINASISLSNKAKEYFLNPENKLFFSSASYWEICIKISIGKLKLIKDWVKKIDKEILENEIHWLPVQKIHCLGIVSLPFLHRDPFDRILIAQAMNEGMKILTSDKNIAKYDIEVIW